MQQRSGPLRVLLAQAALLALAGATRVSEEEEGRSEGAEGAEGAAGAALAAALAEELRAGAAEGEGRARYKDPYLTVEIVEEAWCRDKKNKCDLGLPKRFRPTPILMVSEFLDTVHHDGSDWRIAGDVNGWAAWRDLKLLNLDCGKKGLWMAEEAGPGPREALEARQAKCGREAVRATLELPPNYWQGWSETSPGYAFLVHAKTPGEGYTLVGEDIVNKDPDGERCRAARAHYFAHNYGDYSVNEMHVGLFIEWEPRDVCDYGTVIELGWRGAGAGGIQGLSLWLTGKYQQLANAWLMTQMLKDTPGLVRPYESARAEIRMWDLPYRNASEFKKFMMTHSPGGDHGEKHPRFRDADFPATINGKVLSDEVRVSFDRRKDLFRAVLNYVGKNPTYSLIWRNCQTTAADFWAYLTNHRTTVYTVLIRPFYAVRTHWFLSPPAYLGKGL